MAAQTLTELFADAVAAAPDDEFLTDLDATTSYSWAETAERARRVATGLARLGVEAADTVGLLVSNRPEFHVLDLGAVLLRAVPVSIYATSSPEQIVHVADDAGLKVLVCEPPFLDGVLAARADVREPFAVVVLGEDPSGEHATVDDLLGAEPADLGAAVAAADPDDLLTVIYTSGTTGPPKGVELTHANLLAAGRGIGAVNRLEHGGRVICWLPMAHIAERNASYYMAIMYRSHVTTCPDARRIAEALVAVRPTWFFAVPRVWEKLKAGIDRALGDTPVADADHARLRAAIGLDEARCTNVGAAPCAPEVIERMHEIGIPLAEIWGMSEGCACGTLNPPDDIRIGSCGQAIPGMELRIAEDGEVELRGPTLMRGYRNRPEETADAFTPDGFYRTGDVGRLDEDGYLWLLDRKKELIISSAGKNMSPANIEATLKSASPLIGQAVVVGDGHPYNVALLVPDPEAAAGFDGDVEAAIGAGVQTANDRLSRVEQIKRFTVLADDWAPGGDELTPTMKLKRKPIAEKYAAEIEALYTRE